MDVAASYHRLYPHGTPLVVPSPRARRLTGPATAWPAAVSGQLELLVPGRISPGADWRDAYIEDIGLAAGDHLHRPSERPLQVLWRGHFGAIHPLRFGEHDEVDLRVAEVDLR